MMAGGVPLPALPRVARRVDASGGGGLQVLEGVVHYRLPFHDVTAEGRLEVEVATGMPLDVKIVSLA